jgi:hypothetical protein
MSHTSSLELHRFRVAAANFIQAVDASPDVQCEEFLSRMSHCLAELYSSALCLPAGEPDTTGTDETPFAKEESAALFHALREKIGSVDAYWVVFDSTEKASPVQGSLAGDISEIYSDLKQDLQREEKRISQADFLWELRFSFRSHWGKHLLGALRAIHDRQVA